jgi:hypothetical protein
MDHPTKRSPTLFVKFIDRSDWHGTHIFLIQYTGNEDAIDRLNKACEGLSDDGWEIEMESKISYKEAKVLVKHAGEVMSCTTCAKADWFCPMTWNRRSWITFTMVEYGTRTNETSTKKIPWCFPPFS